MNPYNNSFKYSIINTPLGDMYVIANEHQLYTLKFCDSYDLQTNCLQLQNQLKCSITLGRNGCIDSLEDELNKYFAGSLEKFKTPLNPLGTRFQQMAWQILTTIPYGTTISYTQQAIMLDKPTSYRAVANANRVNPCVIIIPCHRIIRNNGNLAGYNGNIERKQWLINHEKNNP